MCGRVKHGQEPSMFQSVRLYTVSYSILEICILCGPAKLYEGTSTQTVFVTPHAAWTTPNPRPAGRCVVVLRKRP